MLRVRGMIRVVWGRREHCVQFRDLHSSLGELLVVGGQPLDDLRTGGRVLLAVRHKRMQGIIICIYGLRLEMHVVMGSEQRQLVGAPARKLKIHIHVIGGKGAPNELTRTFPRV